MTPPTPTVIPLYTTRGDVEAFLVYPYIYNRQGEWIGFAQPNREIYSVLGYYVGELSPDKRILRKRAIDEEKPRQLPPPAPARLRAPSGLPLPPMMRELPHSTIDILEDLPELLHTKDSGEFTQDLD